MSVYDGDNENELFSRLEKCVVRIPRSEGEVLSKVSLYSRFQRVVEVVDSGIPYSIDA